MIPLQAKGKGTVGCRYISRSLGRISRSSCIGGILTKVSDSAPYAACKARSFTLLLTLFILLLPKGQPHVLLTQDEVYGSLVTRFFETHHYPELGWIHHIACKRYGEAAGALTQVLDEGEGREESGELDFRKVSPPYSSALIQALLN